MTCVRPITLAILLCGVTFWGCAGPQGELSEESTVLSDEKANPYLFNRAIAMTMLRTQQPQEATRVIRRLMDLDADSAEPYYLLGRAHVDMRDFPAAQSALQQALRRNPEYAEAHSMYGVLLDMLGQHEQARVYHRRAIRYAPRKAEFRNNLGFHFYLCQQYDRAAKAYEAALARDPGSRRMHNNLGFAYAKLGKLEEARNQFRYAGPPAQGVNNLGVVFEERGDLETAYDYYLTACRIDPQLVPSRANLARVCARLGRELPELPSPEPAAREAQDPASSAALSAPVPTEPAEPALPGKSSPEDAP